MFEDETLGQTEGLRSTRSVVLSLYVKSAYKAFDKNTFHHITSSRNKLVSQVETLSYLIAGAV